MKHSILEEEPSTVRHDPIKMEAARAEIRARNEQKRQERAEQKQRERAEQRAQQSEDQPQDAVQEQEQSVAPAPAIAPVQATPQVRSHHWGGRREIDAELRFEKLYDVDETLGCFVWKRAPGSRGRVLFFNGTKQVDARVFAWEMQNKFAVPGPIRNTCAARKGKYICVNPAHMTHRSVETRKQAAFTAEQVREIRERFRDGERIYIIAKDYEASEKSVDNVARGITYTWVTD
jgi:hypothetical protein